ncbi:unnamed protein product [Paramecium sonneborni]|uniref:Uncharacterized protein n=1 Tax=Paramecium sonneborni TaxID=65129 RepID=A0A8S1PMZ6_9CILI|nr:unnamed protein product [Paramecium sonneborni]
MQENNIQNIENHNISVVKFSNDEQSSQSQPRAEKSLNNQQEQENSMFLIQNHEVVEKFSEQEIEIIQFADNREIIFGNNQAEGENEFQKQKKEQIIVQNIVVPEQYNNLYQNDRNIAIIQEPIQQNYAQDQYINQQPIIITHQQAMIPNQQQNTPIQPTDKYQSYQNQQIENEEYDKKKKKKIDQKNSDQHYKNNVVIVPVNQNDAADNAIVNLGSNLSVYCCLGLLNRSDNCCQWICDLLVFCLSFPIIMLKKLIILIWDGCLEVLCSKWCPNCHESCKTCCGLSFFNCVRCYNSLKRNSNTICTQLCCCVNCTVFSKEVLQCWDSCSQFCLQICSAFGGCLLVCCEFILNNLGDCFYQICTFCCDFLGNSCEIICQVSEVVCNNLAEILGFCLLCCK